MKLSNQQKKKLKERRLKKARLKKEYLEKKMSNLMTRMMEDMKGSLEKHKKEGDYVPKTMQQTSSGGSTGE